MPELPTPEPLPTAGERTTRQRSAILHALRHAGRPLSPQELLEGARVAVESISLATVYRSIKLMEEEGLITRVPLPGEPDRYESAGKPHHHHFHCRGCGRVFEVDGCPPNLEHLLPKGFTLDSHELTLYGRCADCIGTGR